MASSVSPYRRSTRTRRLLLYVAALVIGFAFVLPLVWMMSTSVKPESQAMSRNPSLLPAPPSSVFGLAKDNYSAVWNDPVVEFPLYLRNTLIIAALAVLGMVVSTAIVAFGFSRLRWKGRDWCFALVVATMMVPFPVLMVPLYLMYAKAGMIGTFLPMWLPAWFGGAFHGGFNIFLLREFFRGIPQDLDEAARIDGCSSWGVFRHIILPLSKPALAIVALFYFIFVWNDFLMPLIFLNHRDQFTLALGLQLYQSKAGFTPWNLLMAASTLVILPILVLFVLTEKMLVRGVSMEGMKA